MSEADPTSGSTCGQRRDPNSIRFGPPLPACGSGLCPRAQPPLPSRRERTVAGAYEFTGLGTVTDIRRLLEVAAIDTLSLENSVARSRTLAYLGQTALKCLEVGEFEDRLTLLEAAIRSRELSPAADFDLDLDIGDEPSDRKELTP